MVQFPYLSTTISKARAIATGGAALDQVVGEFDSWLLKHRNIKNVRGLLTLKIWAENLSNTIGAGKEYGMPVARLLRETGLMVKKEEKLWLKLISLEKQYAFQGAVAMVLPWGVVALLGGIQSNLLTWSGLVFQSLGLWLFYLIVKKATKPIDDERIWLRDLMTLIWMRVLSGQTLWISINRVVSDAPFTEKNIEKKIFFKNWKAWFHSVNVAGAGEGGADFHFLRNLVRSKEAGNLLNALLVSGAPSENALEDMIRQLDEEYTVAVEEKIGSVPVSLSLIFCFFMTPAVFLILMGALWPMIRNYL